MKKLLKKKSKGFTLVELIVVIAILVILAAILIPTMTGVINDAKEAAGNANARTVYSAAMAYAAKNYNTANALEASKEYNDKLDAYLGTGFTGDYTFSTDASANVLKSTWTDGTNTYTYQP